MICSHLKHAHVCVYIYIYVLKKKYECRKKRSHHISSNQSYQSISTCCIERFTTCVLKTFTTLGAALPGSRSAPRPSKSAFNLASAACDTERSHAKSAESAEHPMENEQKNFKDLRRSSSLHLLLSFFPKMGYNK